MTTREILEKAKLAKFTLEMKRDPSLSRQKTLGEMMYTQILHEVEKREDGFQIRVEKLLADFFDHVLSILSEIELEKGEPGKDSDQAAIIAEVLPQVIAKIPPPLKAEPYVLTEKDREDIIKKMPVLEKVIEKRTERIVVEKPTITEIVKERAIPESAHEMVGKLNQLEEELDPRAIKGWQSTIDGIYKAIQGAVRKSKPYLHGGGSSTSSAISIIAVSGTINNSNTSFTAASQPTLLNINGAFYQQAGGAITWSYVAGTITTSSPIGNGGQIYGI